MSDLHDRAARVLGWSANDVRSVSMQSLRDLVHPIDPNLAQEISLAIQSGAYARSGTAPRKGRHHATTGGMKIWQRVKKVPAVSMGDTEVDKWFERDRAHVALMNKKTGDTLLDFWDEDVSQLVEDGFLDPRDWHGSLYAYALHLGAIRPR